jgi:hypothetical protein
MSFERKPSRHVNVTGLADIFRSYELTDLPADG